MPTNLKDDLASLRIDQSARAGSSKRGLWITLVIVLVAVATVGWVWSTRVDAIAVKTVAVKAETGGGPAPGAGLNASDFGEFVRSDGAKQTTFRGWPLYYFAGDTAAGDTKGDNLGDPRPTDLWFVLKDPFYAALVLTKNGGPSLYLADPAGRALYVFASDTVGSAASAPVSACTDPGCLGAWPVFAAGSGTLPTGLDPAKLTSFTRPDGAKQSAFDGHPLYYFAGDTSPGATSGRGVDGFDTANPSSL